MYRIKGRNRREKKYIKVMRDIIKVWHGNNRLLVK